MILMVQLLLVCSHHLPPHPPPCTELARRPALAGVACVCGVPPTGNRDIVMRVFRKSLWEAWKITWWVLGGGRLGGQA